MTPEDWRDLDFLLFDWLDAQALVALPRFRGQGPDDWRAVLDLAGSLALRAFLPAWKPADRDEPRLDASGRVSVHPGVRAAVTAYLDAGLQLMTADAAHGGMQLPFTVATAAMARLSAANISAAGFAMLSVANTRVLTAFGTPSQIAAFARPQMQGAALGTMCLSEPQAGSALGDIATRALPDGADGLGPRYRLRGQKMWISGGDQDIVANTIHLVLAKIPGPDGALPEGSRGISLFVVPAVLPDGIRNDVAVAGLNRKLGYRGIPNCVLGFGEATGGATGWLIGEPGQGLPIMFQMMNEARIQVGLGAAALAWRGYRLARHYAAERRQGRAAGAAGPVAIDRHPDVRRMLLAQKAIAEGGLALCLKSAWFQDLSLHGRDGDARAQARALLDLLTPLAKSWPSEQGLVASDLAIQVHGGYGYSRDFDVEQLYRDNRLNPIHEGTTGIQGLDLVGRKLRGDGGAALGVLVALIGATVVTARRRPELATPAGQLEAALAAAEGVLRRELIAGPAEAALAQGTSALMALGHLVVGWLWLDIALRVTDRADLAPDLRAGKLAACRYFLAYELPLVGAWLAPAAARDRLLLDIDAAAL